MHRYQRDVDWWYRAVYPPALAHWVLATWSRETVIFVKTMDRGTEMAFNFPYPGDTKSVTVMSDATGFGTRGTSPVLTVSSSNATSCLAATPSTPQFYLYFSPTTPSRCFFIATSWDTPRKSARHYIGVIPQGQSFRINAPTTIGGGGTGFDWTCNICAATPFFFVAGDGHGSSTGGSTDISPFGGGGGGSGCMNAASLVRHRMLSLEALGRHSVEEPVTVVVGEGGTMVGTGVAIATGTAIATNGVCDRMAE